MNDLYVLKKLANTCINFNINMIDKLSHRHVLYKIAYAYKIILLCSKLTDI